MCFAAFEDGVKMKEVRADDDWSVCIVEQPAIRNGTSSHDRTSSEFYIHLKNHTCATDLDLLAVYACCCETELADWKNA